VKLSTLNKTGLIIALVLGVLDVFSPFGPSDGSTGDGPPMAILVIDAVLGLITVVAAIIAWRTGRAGVIRIVAGARVISMITALPAFFVDVPAAVQALVGAFVVVTITCVALMLAPSRRPVPVVD
jgi:hypothetical protein